MASSRFLNRKIHPGLTIDPKIWEAFKNKYSGNVSKEVENLMLQAVSPPEIPSEIFSSHSINSLSLQNADQWAVSYCAGALNLTNTSAPAIYSAGSTSVDPKDIIIK